VFIVVGTVCFVMTQSGIFWTHPRNSRNSYSVVK